MNIIILDSSTDQNFFEAIKRSIISSGYTHSNIETTNIADNLIELTEIHDYDLIIINTEQYPTETIRKNINNEDSLIKKINQSNKKSVIALIDRNITDHAFNIFDNIRHVLSSGINRNAIKNVLDYSQDVIQGREVHDGLDRSVSDEQIKSKSIDIITDSDVNTDLLVDFLEELSELYSQLTGGDELIIKAGGMPTKVGALV